MNKAFLIIVLFLILPPSYALTTGDDFWKNCPGTACPANMPNRDTSVQTSDKYEKMDKKQLDRERNHHEKVINEIQREEIIRDNH